MTEDGKCEWSGNKQGRGRGESHTDQPVSLIWVTVIHHQGLLVVNPDFTAQIAIALLVEQ